LILCSDVKLHHGSQSQALLSLITILRNNFAKNQKNGDVISIKGSFQDFL